MKISLIQKAQTYSTEPQATTKGRAAVVMHCSSFPPAFPSHVLSQLCVPALTALVSVSQ